MKNVVAFIIIVCFSGALRAQYVESSNTVGINHAYSDFASMGGGAVFFDYDNDGWEDLFVTAGFDVDHLYKNNGDGTFTRVTSGWLAMTDVFNTTSAIAGDIDNDGDRDLFITTIRGDQGFDYERNLLFINNGDGTFTEDGAARGVLGKSYSMGSAMFDYNKDGYLDIYVVNYVKTSAVTNDSNGDIDGFAHTCFENFFYENNGDGTFTEKIADVGLGDEGCGLAVTPTDYDMDNDEDLYIANDFGYWVVSSSLKRNNYPTLNYTDVSDVTQTAVPVYAMGIASGDINKDGFFDYYITNIGRNVMLLNNSSHEFTDISDTSGAANTFALEGNGLFTTSWGTAFLDANNDSWVDLFVANGRVPAAEFIATGEEDPNMLFTNNGDTTFTGTQVTADSKRRSRGMAYCDFDKDGDLDVITVVQKSSATNNPKTEFFINETNPNGSDGKNWVQFDLEGVTINKDAIGAKVKITTNGESQIQEVHGQGSHASQHSLVLHFGLANTTTIDEVEITWSNSSSQTFTNVSVNERYELKEGETLSNKNVVFKNEIDVYPNPVKDILQFNNLDKTVEISIFSMDGKLIDKKTISTQIPSYNTQKLSKGIYLLQIKEDKKITTKKFIKE